MNGNRRVRGRHRAFATILALGILITACQTVSHIKILRQAQKDFSATTAQTNEVTLDTIVPIADDAKKWSGQIQPRLETGFKLPGALEYYSSYTEVAETLSKLNQHEKAKLQADHLYGTSVTLEILARWKKSFFAHLLNLESSKDLGERGKQIKITDPVGNEVKVVFKLPPTKSLLNIRAMARAALATVDKKQLFARDLFILHAIEPLIRYDNAYIHTLKRSHEGKFKETDKGKLRKTVSEIVEEMAMAEKLLAAAKFPADAPYMGQYVAASRYTMIRTACNLVTKYKVESDDAATVFPTLSLRRAEMLKAIKGDQDQAMHTFLTNAGITGELKFDASIGAIQ